jgi:hypothetical protein
LIIIVKRTSSWHLNSNRPPLLENFCSASAWDLSHGRPAAGPMKSALKCVTFYLLLLACITRITLWRGAQLVHQSNERKLFSAAAILLMHPAINSDRSHSQEPAPPRFSFSALSLGFEISDNEQLSCFYAVKAMR